MERRIAVLFHERDRHRNLASYAVFHLAPFWREAGHEVRFLFGTRERVPADLVFVHVDLSVVPDEYLEFAARYPVAVNGRIKDIRKSRFSEHRIGGPGDPWAGPVIVKSDLNSAGRPELALWEAGWIGRLPAARLVRRAFDKLTGRKPPFLTTRDYEIYDRLAAVPERYFRDRRVLIEKFLPEVESGFYHTRIYQFLGDRSSVSRLVASDPLVNVSVTIRIEDVAPHPEIVIWRRRLELDYGKLDYGVVGGKVVLYDVNKTTGSVPRGPDTNLWALRRNRAQGIESFF